MTAQLTTEDFKSQVLESDRPVLVDFSATWCPPCKMQLPILDEVAQALGETALVAKVDVDAEPALAQLFQIRSIPTLIVFKGGKIAQRFQGLTKGSALIAAVNAA